MGRWIKASRERSDFTGIVAGRLPGRKEKAENQRWVSGTSDGVAIIADLLQPGQQVDEGQTAFDAAELFFRFLLINLG